MNEDKMVQLREKIEGLAELLTFMSVQLSVVNELVAAEMPKVLAEFHTAKQMAREMGLNDDMLQVDFINPM